MRLLLTNDDGAYAPGIKALHRALAPEHEVWVVAPETEQSAVGHAITLADPIRVHPLTPESGMSGWAVTGTPADCVKLALRELLPEGAGHGHLGHQPGGQRGGEPALLGHGERGHRGGHHGAWPP